MPLDGHSYLVAQGWTGKGTGLRQGAISRPLAIPQKKTLAGLGKERDEAFPFWDHLFSAASKSIQIKISNDDDDDDSDNTEPTGVSLKRTSTGILSNRRPVTGTIATSSGTATPDTEDTSPRLSLLATAKREAAKRGLYSRFFRGPVLGPDTPLHNEPESVEVQDIAPLHVKTVADSVPPKKKKRKVSNEEDDDKLERRRRKKEKKELERIEKGKKRKGKEKETVDELSESKRLKAEKKRRKKEVEAVADESTVQDKSLGTSDGDGADDREMKRKRREEKRRLKANALETLDVLVPADASKSKRKRKHSDTDT